MHGKLTEVDGTSCWCTERWRKVPRMHGMLSEIGGTSHWCTECLHGWSCSSTESSLGLMEGPAVTQNTFRRSHGCTKIDGIWRKVLLTHGKLTDGPSDTRKVNKPADARKLDGKSHCCMESWLKLTEHPAVERNIFSRCHGHTKSWWKLTVGPTDARKADRS